MSIRCFRKKNYYDMLKIVQNFRNILDFFKEKKRNKEGDKYV